MIAAVAPREDPRTMRLLHVDPGSGRCVDRPIDALPALLRAEDLLVVNDAATLPASLGGETETGRPVELRLLAEQGDGAWAAVLFGAGDWRTRTEDRPAPPTVAVGDLLYVGGLAATVAAVDPVHARLLTVVFGGRADAFWPALYRAGRPVQYAHTQAPLALWDVQTAYASRPWAAEAPSAGFALTWELLLALRRRGIALARLTHAAGLSSTGDDALDARLPLAERYEIPADTVRDIGAARARGGRIVAVGTTVVRALEGAVAAGHGKLHAGAGITTLRLGAGTRRAVVDGVLTGVHEPGSSHAALLQSFASSGLLEEAHAYAERQGYRGHEFGDAVLVLADGRSVEVDDAALQGDADRHRAVGSPELLHDVGHVPLDGAGADAEHGGERLVGPAARHQP
jgi:S-adenosylmethionine:tRNA ribosyltransferase-isomerase